MRHFLTAVWLTLTLMPLHTRADATDELLQKLAPVKTLSGRFEQTQTVQGSDRVLLSSGHFRLLRPGYFAWDITSPDSQLILATPEYLWQYDRDLETVTRRSTAEADGVSPLQVLGGDEAAIRADYRIDTIDNKGERFQLKPLDKAAGFRSLVLRFKGDTIDGMNIVDSLGQSIEVHFFDVKHNTSLAPEDFSFSPPAGADLFYHDQ
ncbi:MAG: outer membrane lipoprotein chaperone LolA [Parahaliea sp.]